MRLLVAVVLMLAGCTHAQTGVRIKIVTQTQSKGIPHVREQGTSTTTIYAQGVYRRTEFPGWNVPRDLPPTRMVVVQRCDSRVAHMLNLARREYSESSLPSPEEEEKAREATREVARKRSTEGPPNLIVDTVTVDTGETKRAFGHTAHHYIITTKQTPSPELGEEPSEIIEDSWYLDMPDLTTCDTVSPRPRALVAVPVSTRFDGLTGDRKTLQKVRPEFRYSGPGPQGLVVSSKRTTRSVQVSQTGEKQETELITSHDIVEISEEPIDPTLFEVPAGFTKVNGAMQ